MNHQETVENEQVEERRKGHPQTLHQKWRATSLPNKLMVGATIAIALAAVINLTVAIGQWLILGKQLDQMAISANQSERQAILGIGQLAVANRSARSSQEQANAAQDSAEAVNRAMQLDERAWV